MKLLVLVGLLLVTQLLGADNGLRHLLRHSNGSVATVDGSLHQRDRHIACVCGTQGLEGTIRCNLRLGRPFEHVARDMMYRTCMEVVLGGRRLGGRSFLARHLPLWGGIRRHLAFIVTPPLDDDVVIAGNIDDASKELT